MPCITPSVALHAFLRRSEILLAFNRHHVMHSVFFIVPCIEDACKGLFLIQKHSEQQGRVWNLSQQRFHVCFISEYTVSIFFN